MVDSDAIAVKFTAFRELVLLFSLLLRPRIICVRVLLMVVTFRLTWVRGGDDGVGVAGHEG